MGGSGKMATGWRGLAALLGAAFAAAAWGQGDRLLSLDEIHIMVARARASGSKAEMDRTSAVLRSQHVARSQFYTRLGLQPPKNFGFKPDIFDAIRYEIVRAGYPNDFIDGQMYLDAAEHVKGMRSYRDAITSDPGIAVAFDAKWFYRGPNNLDIPYRIYWGTRPVSGRVNAVLYDWGDPSNDYFIGTGNGGVWKTTNAGVDWRPLSDDWDVLSVSSLAQHPTNNQIFFAGTGDLPRRSSSLTSNGRTSVGVGIMKTLDDGATWTNVGRAQMLGTVVSSILIDPESPTTMIATCTAGSNQGVYRSADGGNTWGRVTTIPQLPFTRASVSAADGTGVRRYYVVAEGTSATTPARLFVSSDRGATWAERTIPVNAGSYSLIDVSASPTNPTGVYLLVCTEREVHESADAGLTWTATTGDLPGGDGNYNWSQATYDWKLTATPRSAGSGFDALYVSLIDLCVSLNANTTWRSIGGPTYDFFNAQTHNDQHALAANPSDPTEILVGNDGGVYRVRIDRRSGAATYTNLNRTLGITMHYYGVWATNDLDRILSGAQDNATPVAADDLSNWRAPVGGDGTGVAMLQSNTDRQYATNQNLGSDTSGGDRSISLWLTQHNWFFTPREVSVDVSQSEIDNNNIPFVGPLGSKPSIDQTFVGTNRLYRWEDDIFGGGWDARCSPSLCGAGNFVTAISCRDNRVIVGTSNGRIWFGTGNPTSGGVFIWTENFGINLPSRPILAISQDNTTNEVVVGLGGAAGFPRVWFTSNITSTSGGWSTASGSGNDRIPDVPVNSIVRDLQDPRTTWYAATDVGVFFTNDSGGNWFDMTEPMGLPNVRVTSLGWNNTAGGSRRLNCSTYGRGIWRIVARSGEPWIGEITHPNSLVGGEEALCFVELSRPAPPGGLVMNLVSSNTSALTVPATVNIAEGLTGAFFRATSRPVSTNVNVTVNVSIAGDERDVPILVKNTMIDSFTVTPATGIGGLPLQGTVRLIGPAPETGYRIFLDYEGPRTLIPSELKFAPRQIERTFPIGTSRVQTPTELKLFARWRNMQEVKQVVTLNPY